MCALFKGAINSIDVPIINDPFREARATYKPFQLAAAKKFGLDVPKTLMSNNADGLNYGCVDMRKAPDGSYKFFEINPSGQFLFVEIDTGQPLVRNLAALLAQRCSSD
jgi:hypothetical protein